VALGRRRIWVHAEWGRQGRAPVRKAAVAEGQRPSAAGVRGSVVRPRGASGTAAAQHGPARRRGHGPPRAARVRPTPGVGARLPGGGARIRGPSRHGLSRRREGRGGRCAQGRRHAGRPRTPSANGRRQGRQRARVGVRLARWRWKKAGRKEAAPGREGWASRGQRWEAAAGWWSAGGGCSGKRGKKA
jgi:hypothetical protein